MLFLTVAAGCDEATAPKADPLDTRPGADLSPLGMAKPISGLRDYDVTFTGTPGTGTIGYTTLYRDYPVPGATSVAWTVFDPQGAMLGQVAMPATFRPTDIGRNYVLGVWTDELGVERIRLYSLRKP